MIRQLREDKTTDWDICYIGRKHNSSVDQKKAIESEVIPKSGVKFYGISSGKFDRRWLPNTIRGIPQIFKGFSEAKKIIENIKPDIVVSFGGYVSVPVVYSASNLQIPSITHEQTFTSSLSTKINSMFCQKVALSFAHKTLNKKEVVTGNLLRQEIFESKSKLFDNLIGNKSKPILFITAGNQGSKIINDNILNIYPQLSKYSIVHQTGESDFSRCLQFASDKKNYYPFPYINASDIGWVYKKSQIVISRAGANTCQEIAILDKKAIIIPLLVSQQNEQGLNAQWLKKLHPNKTIIIDQSKLTTKLLLKKINYLSKIKTKATVSAPEPNYKLLDLIYEII